MARESPAIRSPLAAALAARIHARLLHRGWDVGDLARAGGLSRTTLHKLLTRGTRFPHRRTVARIAQALGVSPGELWGDPSFDDPAEPPVNAPAGLSSVGFDRATNPCVTEVSAAMPALFAGWLPTDWDQLYSTFGTGGPLTPEGVRGAAARINRRRETVRQLELVMETHLADVAAELVATLHRLTRPAHSAANLEPAPDLVRVLASLRRETTAESSADRLECP